MDERLWHKSYAPGIPASVDYEEVTLPAGFDRTAGKYPDLTALIMMGRKISYRELKNLVDRFAAALAEEGIGKGDKVALIMPNMPQMVVATYAVFKLGAVVVNCNPLYTERELEHQLNDSDSKMAICMDLLVPRIKKLQSTTGVKKIIACHLRDYLPFPIKQLFPYVKKGMHRPVQPGEGVLDFMDLLARHKTGRTQNDAGWNDLAALLYTGGTTGVSKGVILTHKNLSVNVQQLRAWIPDANEGRDTIIGIFPFFHSAGFTAVMNQSLFRGLTIILVPRPEPQTVLEMTRKYKPVWFPCVPTIYVGCLGHPDFPKTDFTSVKGCVSGAARWLWKPYANGKRPWEPPLSRCTA